MGEAIKSLERKDCPVPSKRLRGNCILGSNFELNSMASSLSLEGSSWIGMLDLDFLATMWTHHWEVNMFSLISELCGLVASVLVKHRLLFLYLNRWYFRHCLSDAEGCKAEFVTGVRISGTGILWGRGSRSGRRWCVPVVPVPGGCWVQIEHPSLWHPGDTCWKSRVQPLVFFTSC